ncbi:DUF3891 family protein [Fulvivirga ligni]|uniref:DUF3891 family protein n=1 Tax=Fulvivirga ligni TaxID=2904246 RepID=UPI001F249F74|nr:DUF3891 family protein [Fulvivirga ligni]UII20161.1 DUF3891 family protein [Fulvivirga ligni]
MIVNRKKHGWDIIFQRNHALLAGLVANEVQPAFRPPRWIETLCAILEHDDGQKDWNISTRLSEQGEPLDFTAYDCDLSQAKEVVKESFYKSRWINLLVSMHTSSLYSSVQDKSEDLKRFLTEQEDIQKKIKAELNLSEEQAKDYYSFLRWCDEFSLKLCRSDWERGDHLSLPSLADKNCNLIIAKNGDLTLEPWIFKEKEITVFAEVYELKKESFSSDEELKVAIEKTEPIRREWKIRLNE